MESNIFNRKISSNIEDLEKLSEKYPEKKKLFEKIAKKCDLCRVQAGLHYPSDGEYSKKLVDLFY